MATIDDQAREWRRRLDQLNLQAARGGNNTAPEIRIEIEDITKRLSQIDGIKHQLKLLDIHRGNARQYLSQIAMMSGQHATPPQVNGLSEARKNIQHVKHVLLKEYGMVADSAPEDDVQPESRPEPMPPILEDDTMALLRQGLRNLEEMLMKGQHADALHQVRLLKRLAR